MRLSKRILPVAVSGDSGFSGRQAVFRWFRIFEPRLGIFLRLQRIQKIRRNSSGQNCCPRCPQRASVHFQVTVWCRFVGQGPICMLFLLAAVALVTFFLWLLIGLTGILAHYRCGMIQA